jgi:hypothetical protein
MQFTVKQVPTAQVVTTEELSRIAANTNPKTGRRMYKLRPNTVIPKPLRIEPFGLGPNNEGPSGYLLPMPVAANESSA